MNEANTLADVIGQPALVGKAVLYTVDHDDWAAIRENLPAFDKTHGQHLQGVITAIEKIDWDGATLVTVRVVVQDEPRLEVEIQDVRLDKADEAAGTVGTCVLVDAG